MKSKKDNGVFEAIRMAAMSHHLLTAGTILCVAASVVASLLPPLLLAGPAATIHHDELQLLQGLNLAADPLQAEQRLRELDLLEDAPCAS